MTTYIEYELADHTTILIEAQAPEVGGVVPAARTPDGDMIVKAGQKFSDALATIRSQAIELRNQLEGLSPNEVEVKFGIKTTGSLGVLAIGNLGAEVIYEVTLKWKQDESATPK